MEHTVKVANSLPRSPRLRQQRPSKGPGDSHGLPFHTPQERPESWKKVLGHFLSQEEPDSKQVPGGFAPIGLRLEELVGRGLQGGTGGLSPPALRRRPRRPTHVKLISGVWAPLSRGLCPKPPAQFIPPRNVCPLPPRVFEYQPAPLNTQPAPGGGVSGPGFVGRGRARISRPWLKWKNHR